MSKAELLVKKLDKSGFCLEWDEENIKEAAAHLRALDASHQRLKEALEDMYNGWRYIRMMHGDLYGVGWDRAEGKADAALKQAKDLE